MWEKELERFFSLEEKVGVLVENLMAFRCREDVEKGQCFEAQRYLQSAIGRFRRYPEVTKALRLVLHDAGYYFQKDMKHESKADFEEVKNNLEESYQTFLEACDGVLKRK